MNRHTTLRQMLGFARLFPVARRRAPKRAAWGGMDALEPRALFAAAPPGIIVFNSPGTGGSYDIWAMNIDGTNVHDLTPNAAIDAYPQVSEDGTTVAFASDRATPGKLDIYTMNIDGSNVKRITTDGASWDPAFNYDKSKLLFTSTGADGLYDIFTINPDGTGRTNVSHNPGVDEFASWNDDGTKIIFGSYRDVTPATMNNEEIYTMNADGTGQTRLTFNTARDVYAAYSADGRIALTSDRDGNREIYVMNGDGTNPVNITNNASTDQIPYWEPDGDRLSYTSYRDGNGEIYIVNSDGSNNHRITFNTVQDVYAGWGETPPAPPPPLPSITIADAAITEGNSGTKLLNFTVTLSAASAQSVSAAFATISGTAVSSGAAPDFVSATGIVTFAPGQLTQNISITINGDATFEPNETFTVNLTGPLNATIADGQAVGTITNDDVNPPGTIMLAATSYTVSETGPTVTFTVLRSGGSGGAVGVSYATVNGTAQANSDYTAVAGALTWASGDSSPRYIVVPITDDAVYEGKENFYISLTNVTGGAALTSPAAVVYINDNDPMPASSKFAGAVIGTAGSWNNNGATIAKVFDGNLATYFDAPLASGSWVGLDLGSAKMITKIRFAPRTDIAGGPARMVGGYFQASNTADFSSGNTWLYSINAAPAAGFNDVNLTLPGTFRYVRYVAPANSYGNIAELEFHGF